MRKPLPGYEDLYPHVATLDDPSSPHHGEDIVPTRTLAALLAPSIEAFHAEWNRHEQAVNAGLIKDHFPIPPDWQAGARRRSNELMARYDTTRMYDVVRALHREHGIFPAARPDGQREP
jgi:hypothetical protein